MRQLTVVATALALAAAVAAPAYAIECDGTALPDGCLFTITGGDTADPNDGFAVTNADGVPVWDFVRERDLQAIGYPISQRWIDGPFTLQAFQKVILQWSPGKQRMNWYNTLDALATMYPHVELPSVPPHQALEADQGVTDFGAIMRNHLALLDANPKIKAAFLAEPNWLNLYGLPIRYEEREVDGNPHGLQVLRAQRTVFAIWNVPAPGTTVGAVVLQNVPDQIKRLSNIIIPDIAKAPIALNPRRDLDIHFSSALHTVTNSDPGIANLITQPWFNEHITDEQKAWIIALQYFSSYTSFQRPIESYYIGAYTISLDANRRINVWIIKETQFDDKDELSQRVEDFVRISEEFLGIPFPTTDIVISLTNDYNNIGFGSYGVNLYSYLILNENYLSSLEHELAHYFFNRSLANSDFANIWQVEGGADFLAAYVNHRSGREHITEHRETVAANVKATCIDKLGYHNLHQLNIQFQRTYDRETGSCAYEFGDLFFMEILAIVGDTSLGLSLGEVHAPSYGYGAYGYGTTDEELYQILLRNAPKESRDALRNLYRQLHGAPFTLATSEPVPVSLHPAVAPVLIEFLSWAENPPDSHHADVLKDLVSLWWIDNDLMIDLAQYHWVIDGVNHKESSAIDDIRRIAATDVELGKLASRFSWIVDDIKHWEDWAIRDLRLMVERNLDASRIVMNYPWIKDSLTFDEADAIFFFALVSQSEYFATVEERGITETIVTLPWVLDGLSRTEVRVLGSLQTAADHGKDFLIQVMSIPWVADGISSAHESGALEIIEKMAWVDIGLTKAVLKLPWTADGWDFVEWQALSRINSIFDSSQTDVSDPNRAIALDPALGLQVVSFPWFTDGINGLEVSALGELRGMSYEDVALGTRILGFGWFRDDITDVEARAVHHLHRITEHNVDLARQVLTYPWVVDGITESEVASLASMAP